MWLNIILAPLFSQNLLSTCIYDDRSLTETLFQDYPGQIFTCKVLSVTKREVPAKSDLPEISDFNSLEIARVKIIEIYFGQIKNSIISIKTNYQINAGDEILIYNKENDELPYFGSSCSVVRSKIIINSPEVHNELELIRKFSKIRNDKNSGVFVFCDNNGKVLACGNYLKGNPVGKWDHFHENGNIKSEFELDKETATVYFENGFLKSKSSVTNNLNVFESYSQKHHNKLEFKTFTFSNDTVVKTEVNIYHDNGNLKEVYNTLLYSHKSNSPSKCGVYKEFFPSGTLKLIGQYLKDRRIGVWKWFDENGISYSEFDYKDGTGNQ